MNDDDDDDYYDETPLPNNTIPNKIKQTRTKRDDNIHYLLT